MPKSKKTLSVMVVSGGGGVMADESGVGRDTVVDRKRRERRVRLSF